MILEAIIQSSSMKKVLGILLLLALFPGRVRAQGNCIPVVSTDVSQISYKSGEHATYALKYKWGVINTDVATASVDLDSVVVNGVKAYHCKLFGQTSGIFKRLFRIREDFQSWFSCDGVRPIRFYRNTMENSYVAKNDYIFRWDAEPPYIDATVYSSSTDSTKVMQIPLKECTFDLPSLYYFARNIDMSRVEKDIRYPMTFAIDDEVYDVYYIYKGKEKVKTPELGHVNCLHFQAKLIAGEVFRGDHDMDIYVSDDGNKVPVFFRAEIAVGEAQGRLVEHSGLKYPLVHTPASKWKR